MTCQLVLQWPASSMDDYYKMIANEDLLIELLPREAFVDGHDIGSGTANIFIITEQPKEIFQIAKKILIDHDSWSGVRAAFRDTADDNCICLWPPDLKEFKLF